MPRGRNCSSHQKNRNTEIDIPSLFSSTPGMAGFRFRQRRRTPYDPGCSAPSLNISEISAESSMKLPHRHAVRPERFLNEQPLYQRKDGSDLIHCRKHTGNEPGIAITYLLRFKEAGWKHRSVILTEQRTFALASPLLNRIH